MIPDDGMTGGDDGGLPLPESRTRGREFREFKGGDSGEWGKILEQSFFSTVTTPRIIDDVDT